MESPAAVEKSEPQIMTVTGPVSASDLEGVFSLHEHIFIKSAPLFPQASCAERMLVDGDPKGAVGAGMAHVSMDVLGKLRENPFSLMDNCTVNQEDNAEAELRAYLAEGGGLVVDATPCDSGRNARALRRVSETTGIRVVMGCGFGPAHAHPPHLTGETEAVIASGIELEIKGGVADSDAHNRIMPGIIGAIGVSKLCEAEVKVVRAASLAQQRTGCAVMIRISGGDCAVASRVLTAIEETGGDLMRVCLTGMGASSSEWDAHKALLDRSCSIVYDGAGCYCFLPEGGGVQMPGDDVLALAVKRAVDGGYAKQLLISHGGFLKMHRAKWGGAGIAHLCCSFIPRLVRLGISREVIAQMTDANPKRLLSFYHPPPPAPPSVPTFVCDACGNTSPFGKEFTKFDYIMCSAPCLTAQRKKTNNWTTK